MACPWQTPQTHRIPRTIANRKPALRSCPLNRQNGPNPLIKWCARRKTTVGGDSARTAGFPGAGSIALNCAVEVPGVVRTARSFINCSFRVETKGASHVDAATFVDSSSGNGFGGFILLAPAFERGKSVELIGAGPAAAMGHAGDQEAAQLVVSSALTKT